jgi:hypothetical protein
MTAYDVRAKLRAFAVLLLERLSESSTWQGLGFLITFAGVKFSTGFELSDPQALAGATAAGALVSAVLKIFLPDSWRKP